MGVVNGTASPRSTSPAWISSVAGPFTNPPLKRNRLNLRRLVPDAIAGGADHRFDELAIRVFVAAVHQLAEALRTLRAIVVAAGEIERADRVVLRPHGEDA